LCISRRERNVGNNENRNIFIADNWRKRKKKTFQVCVASIFTAVVDNGPKKCIN
jgi:hypothetical protein